MIVVNVNGERVPLHMDEDEDFNSFIRRADPEQIIGVIARCAQLMIDAGCSDVEVQRGVSDVGMQIAAILGHVTTH